MIVELALYEAIVERAKVDLTTPLITILTQGSINIQELTQRALFCVRYRMLVFAFFFEILLSSEHIHGSCVHGI